MATTPISNYIIITATSLSDLETRFPAANHKNTIGNILGALYVVMADKWELYKPSSADTSLEKLVDVNVNNPADRQVIEYNTATSSWINKNQSGGNGVVTETISYIQTQTDKYAAALTPQFFALYGGSYTGSLFNIVTEDLGEQSLNNNTAKFTPSGAGMLITAEFYVKSNQEFAADFGMFCAPKYTQTGSEAPQIVFKDGSVTVSHGSAFRGTSDRLFKKVITTFVAPDTKDYWVQLFTFADGSVTATVSIEEIRLTMMQV